MTAKHSVVHVGLATIILLAGLGAPARAAGQPSGQEAAKAALLPSIPVRVDVVLTRSQGEKKVTSLPFSLLATATDSRERERSVSMRMGIDVPIGTATTTSAPSGSGAQATGTTSTRVTYRNVGTDIDGLVIRLDETHFSVRVSVSDSSIYSAEGDPSKAVRSSNVDPAAFRTFSTSNTVVLKDGQTVLFGVGTDKVSGETLKIEVSLHVVK